MMASLLGLFLGPKLGVLLNVTCCWDKAPQYLERFEILIQALCNLPRPYPQILNAVLQRLGSKVIISAHIHQAVPEGKIATV
jgi:hypothetical protein